MARNLSRSFNGKNIFIKKTIAYGFSAFSILFLGYILIAAINHVMQK